MGKVAQRWPYVLEEREPVSYRLLVQLVSTYTFITVPDIMSRSRQQDIMDARRMCYAVLSEAGESWKEIGRYFRRDHSTILEGYQQHQRLFHTDAKYRQTYTQIKEALA